MATSRESVADSIRSAIKKLEIAQQATVNNGDMHEVAQKLAETSYELGWVNYAAETCASEEENEVIAEEWSRHTDGDWPHAI